MHLTATIFFNPWAIEVNVRVNIGKASITTKSIRHDASLFTFSKKKPNKEQLYIGLSV